MKKLSLLPMLIFIFLIITLPVIANENELITYLRDKDWMARQNAANMLGSMRSKASVKPLIDALADETNDNVKTAVNNALVLITEQKLAADYDAWMNWWEESGHKQFEFINPSQREIAEARTYLTISFIVIVISLLLLLLFIMVFSFIGGSKIKEVKDLIKKVERYVSDAEGVTQRFDKMIEEIEKRRLESVDFFHKLKEENTAEIERFSDLLQENTEHRIREITMSLREKAETELKATVSQARQDIERDVKRFFLEYQERIGAELDKNKKLFISEIDAYTIFIEGSFSLVNGRYKDALKYFKKALELKPDYYHIWNNNGTALRHLGLYDEAIESYQKALNISTNNPVILYNFAAAYSLKRNKQEMMKYLKRALELDEELKDEALNDNAFKEYWSDKEFKNIAES